VLSRRTASAPLVLGKGRVGNLNARRYVTTSVVSNVCALGQGGANAPKRARAGAAALNAFLRIATPFNARRFSKKPVDKLLFAW
jgi:hypothetical protein